MVCRLEVLEASGCTLLSCNVAWHEDIATTYPQHTSHSQPEGSNRVDSNRGYVTVHDAVTHALAALGSVKAPAVPTAPALQVPSP